jgi:hypothetical protein
VTTADPVMAAAGLEEEEVEAEEEEEEEVAVVEAATEEVDDATGVEAEDWVLEAVDAPDILNDAKTCWFCVQNPRVQHKVATNQAHHQQIRISTVQRVSQMDDGAADLSGF